MSPRALCMRGSLPHLRQGKVSGIVSSDRLHDTVCSAYPEEHTIVGTCCLLVMRHDVTIQRACFVYSLHQRSLAGCPGLAGIGLACYMLAGRGTGPALRMLLLVEDMGAAWYSVGSRPAMQQVRSCSRGFRPALCAEPQWGLAYRQISQRKGPNHVRSYTDDAGRDRLF
jgi:hypothetical protein